MAFFHSCILDIVMFHQYECCVSVFPSQSETSVTVMPLRGKNALVLFLYNQHVAIPMVSNLALRD